MTRRLWLALFLLLAAPLARAADPIEIGVILPLSGDLAPFGTKVRDGIMFAADEHPGRFRLNIEDAELSNTKALSAFQKLAATRKPAVILGPFGPGQTLTIMPAADNADTVVIAVALCDKRFEPLERLFCLYPTASDQLKPITAHFREGHPGITTAGVILEEVDGIDGGRESFEKFVASRGATMVALKTVPTGASDFRPLLAQMKAVDLFVYGGLPANAVVLFRQMKELGISPRYRWLWTELDDRIFSENKEIFEGAYLPGGMTAFTPEFRKRFTARFGYEPDLYHAIGYDGAASAFDVLAKHPGIRGGALVRELIALRRANTAVERFHFNSRRAVSMPLDVAVLENGKPRLLRREAPEQ